MPPTHNLEKEDKLIEKIMYDKMPMIKNNDYIDLVYEWMQQKVKETS
jgi:hypothetical protein